MIREVWETINTSYYNERDPTFSKEKWAALRDEALKQKPKNKYSAYRSTLAPVPHSNAALGSSEA